MAGTREGGKATRETNYKKYGRDFYKRIGAIGGSNAVKPKGFAVNRELARIAGAKGGRVSKRNGKKA